MLFCVLRIFDFITVFSEIYHETLRILLLNYLKHLTIAFLFVRKPVSPLLLF